MLTLEVFTDPNEEDIELGIEDFDMQNGIRLWQDGEGCVWMTLKQLEKLIAFATKEGWVYRN